MAHHRKLLFLLAIAVILVSGTPASAATGDPAPQVAAPAAGSALEAGLCLDPGPAGSTQVPSPNFASPPIDDFVLCTCTLCVPNPDEYCQISPSGYTIQCKDWAKTHCHL